MTILILITFVRLKGIDLHHSTFKIIVLIILVLVEAIDFLTLCFIMRFLNLFIFEFRCRLNFIRINKIHLRHAI